MCPGKRPKTVWGVGDQGKRYKMIQATAATETVTGQVRRYRNCMERQQQELVLSQEASLCLLIG